MLDAVINGAIDGIIVINQNGIIQLANPAAQNLFGYSEGELLDHNISKLVPVPDKARHDSYIAHYLKTGEKHIIGIGREVKGERKDGSLFPFLLSISEAFVEGNRLFIGVIHDITEILQARKQLKKYADELKTG